jgi:hypothetical protein
LAIPGANRSLPGGVEDWLQQMESELLDVQRSGGTTLRIAGANAASAGSTGNAARSSSTPASAGNQTATKSQSVVPTATPTDPRTTGQSEALWAAASAAALPLQAAAGALPTGAVALYQFDTSSGTTAVDSIGGNQGTVFNGAAWTTGRVGNGLRFDGTNDYVRAGHSASLNLKNELTLAAWIRPDALNSYRMVLAKGASGNRFNYYFGTNGDEVNFGFFNGRFYEHQTNAVNLQVGRWYHIAATYSDAANAVRIYVDGAQRYSRAENSSLLTNNEALYIGRSQYGEFARSTLDNVALFNRALAVQEIASLAGTPSSPADTTAPTVTDITPNHGSTGIHPNSNITVAFNEAMNTATISTSTIELRDSANALVAAKVTYNAATLSATVDPTATLANGTRYSLTVRGGTGGARCQDLAGNALASNATGTFTTATAAPDSTPPTVNAVSPGNSATGVSTGTAIKVTFSEAMDPASINSNSIELRNSANTLLAATVAYDATTRSATVDPTASLANGTTYTVRVKGGSTDPRVKDAAGNALASTFTASFTTASSASSGTQMILKSFDGATPPLNLAGYGYPSHYYVAGDPTTGTGTVSVNTADAVSGNSVQMRLTGGTLYAQFNVNDGTRKGFAREYSANPAGWQFNTYNRMRIWIKAPTTATPLMRNGAPNYHVGTYVKRVTNPDAYSDETGGDHYYHHLNVAPTGTWTQVIVNMHPDHRRNDSGNVDQGIKAHPTGESQYNYFDALTRFYITDVRGGPSAYPANYLLDNIEFYHEPYAENDQQIYSLTGTYVAAANRVIVSWNRHKDQHTVNHEVRYAFSNIHAIGWNAATPAPNGVITPPGHGGYNNMVYDSTSLPLSGRSVVYIAIKPQNSTAFSQIAVPLNLG